MERHCTVTGYVVHEGRALLYRYRKLQMWLTPGGHVEPTLREIREETGLTVALLPQVPVIDGFAAPEQLALPVTILVEDIDEAVRKLGLLAIARSAETAVVR